MAAVNDAPFKRRPWRRHSGRTFRPSTLITDTATRRCKAEIPRKQFPRSIPVTGPDLAGVGPGAKLTWGHQVGDCKSLKIKNAKHTHTHTHITNEKDMKGLVGGPLLVGDLGPGPPELPLNPALP